MIGSVQIQTEGELTKEEAEQITAIYEKTFYTGYGRGLFFG